MSKHTPGPWNNSHGGIRSAHGMNIDGTLGGFERHGDGGFIASTRIPRSIQAKSPEQQERLREAQEANAALIAAAPDLLAAVKEMVAQFELTPEWDLCDYDRRMKARALAAIGKATEVVS